MNGWETYRGVNSVLLAAVGLEPRAAAAAAAWLAVFAWGVAAHDRVASVGRGALVAIRGATGEDIVDILDGWDSCGRHSEGEDGEEIRAPHFWVLSEKGCFGKLGLVVLVFGGWDLLCFASRCWAARDDFES
jgi:hypothetical protein